MAVSFMAKHTLVQAAIVIAYLIGSIPTGYWLARLFFDIDITEHGSGNIGATNVARVLGNIKYFFLIFLIDAGKAFVALWVIDWFFMPLISPMFRITNLSLVATMLLLGNSHSIFLRGRGGKGVATLIGIVLFLYPWSVLWTMIGSWLLVLAVSRRVFIASISAAWVATITCMLCTPPEQWLLVVFLLSSTMWLMWRHKSNIKQFLRERR